MLSEGIYPSNLMILLCTGVMYLNTHSKALYCSVVLQQGKEKQEKLQYSRSNLIPSKGAIKNRNTSIRNKTSRNKCSWYI